MNPKTLKIKKKKNDTKKKRKKNERSTSKTQTHKIVFKQSSKVEKLREEQVLRWLTPDTDIRVSRNEPKRAHKLTKQ